MAVRRIGRSYGLFYHCVEALLRYVLFEAEVTFPAVGLEVPLSSGIGEREYSVGPYGGVVGNGSVYPLNPVKSSVGSYGCAYGVFAVAYLFSRLFTYKYVVRLQKCLRIALYYVDAERLEKVRLSGPADYFYFTVVYHYARAVSAAECGGI